MSNRVYFVDFARSYAICLALFDHSMNDFHVWENYSINQYMFFKFFTTSATPTFLFLFGMMLELVYYPRLCKIGLSSIKGKMLKRSFQCYLGYILTSVAGFIGGYLTLKRAFGTSIFVSNNHYGNILKVYCILIILAIPLLLLRKKYGIKSLLVISLFAWLIYPFTQGIEIQNGNIDNFLSTTVGIGESSGPSALHAISIMSLGILSAHFISFQKKYAFLKANLIILAGLVLITLALGSNTTLETITDRYFSNDFRVNNHPLYYSISMSIAVIHIIAFSLIIPLGYKLKSAHQKLLLFGRYSLSAFTIGNVILNLIFMYTMSQVFNIIYPLLFILLTYAIIYFYDRNLEHFNKARTTFINRLKIVMQ